MTFLLILGWLLAGFFCWLWVATLRRWLRVLRQQKRSLEMVNATLEAIKRRATL